MHELIVSGNLGKDAQIKEAMANNRRFITFPIANTEKKAGGVESTTWYQCFIHNEKIVESGSLVNYLKKGTKVLIVGNPSSEIWNKKDGTNVITHSLTVRKIELMGSVSGQHQPVEEMKAAQPAQKPAEKPSTELDESDDDLPF